VVLGNLVRGTDGRSRGIEELSDVVALLEGRRPSDQAQPVDRRLVDELRADLESWSANLSSEVADVASTTLALEGMCKDTHGLMQTEVANIKRSLTSLETKSAAFTEIQKVDAALMDSPASRLKQRPDSLVKLESQTSEGQSKEIQIRMGDMQAQIDATVEAVNKESEERRQADERLESSLKDTRKTLVHGLKEAWKEVQSEKVERQAVTAAVTELHGSRVPRGGNVAAASPSASKAMMDERIRDALQAFERDVVAPLRANKGGIAQVVAQNEDLQQQVVRMYEWVTQHTNSLSASLRQEITARLKVIGAGEPSDTQEGSDDKVEDLRIQVEQITGMIRDLQADGRPPRQAPTKRDGSPLARRMSGTPTSAKRGASPGQRPRVSSTMARLASPALPPRR